MNKKPILFFLFILCINLAGAQQQKQSKDSVINHDVDYDLLFDELDDFLDSLLAPKTYAVLNVGASSGYFDYFSDQNADLESERKLMLTPSVGYYHKSGFGVNGTAAILNEAGKLNPYQFLTSLSYDYLKSMRFASGFSASHFFTKEGLNFYTSPLKNEVYGYFLYRDFWLKPSISANYGWGTRKSVVEREDYLTSLRKRKKKNNIFDTTIITTEESLTESVSDLNLALSVRHDFYWLNVLSNKDFIRFSPQISFISGTQTFGFNQTINTYSSPLNTKRNEFFLSENNNLDERVDFQPLLISAFLKSELTIGKYFFQPQFVVNYYLPAPEKNISTAFSLNTGFVF